MGSEEDALDAYGDFYSDADSSCSCDYYSEAQDAGNYGSDGGSSDYGLPDEDEDNNAAGYKVLSEEDIRLCQKSDIEKVVSVLSVSEAEASILLRSYKWNVSTVQDEWFDDEERVRRTVGLLEKPVVPPSTDSQFVCGICFDLHSRDSFDSAVCGHLYCTNCWRGYIKATVSDGAGCLMLRCPDPSCIAAIGRDMIDKLASDDDKKKYDGFFLRSYVEDSREMKWCPATGCDLAIAFSADSDDCVVSCRCSHTFCWNCSEEPHSPVDCATAAKWFQRHHSQSDNLNWIFVNTKPCPRCKRPIQKLRGCMHMQCPCKHEFCWLCLGPWSKHGEETGGFYHCNSYKQLKSERKIVDSKKERARAKMSLKRYVRYHERWTTNHMSREKAIQDLELSRKVYLPKISVLMGTSEQQLSFIIDAWLEIINCRRFLKWTYAYGYYMPEKDSSKREFFEFLQGEAESALERLHRCTEVEVMKFSNEGPNAPSKEDLASLQIKLPDYTRSTKKFFENLAEALENGLTDVRSKGPSAPAVPDLTDCFIHFQD